MKLLLSTVLIILLLSSQLVSSQKSDIEKAGDIGLLLVPVSALSLTLLKKDKKGAWQFTKGFILNKALTYSLKVSIKKPRPDNSNTKAFPSGHTSTTFQGASFIHMRYGFKYSILPYAIAGFTAFSRINANKHDGWDILAGAVVGIGSTYLFTTPYQKKHLELVYNSYEGSHLLGFKYKF